MKKYLSLLLIPVMAVITRMAGGGLGAKYLDKKGKQDGKMPVNLSSLPEIVFALIVGGVASLVPNLVELLGIDVPLYANIIYGLLSAVWAYAWMQTGHGVVLPWARAITDPVEHEKYRVRTQTLTPVVDLLAKLLGIEKDGPDGLRSLNYCRLFMGVKGALIGLPILALPLAILWPLSYEIGVRVKKHEVSELLSGTFLGICLAGFLFIYNMLTSKQK